jgi:hypothetical protein
MLFSLTQQFLAIPERLRLRHGQGGLGYFWILANGNMGHGVAVWRHLGVDRVGDRALCPHRTRRTTDAIALRRRARIACARNNVRGVACGSPY